MNRYRKERPYLSPHERERSRVPDRIGLRSRRNHWLISYVYDFGDFNAHMMNKQRRRAEDTAADEFDRLLRPHVAALYRQAYRWTGAVDRAEDLVQDVLIRLYPRLEELRVLDQIQPWAARVMYRIFVDGLRRERRSPVRAFADLFTPEQREREENAADPAAGPAELAERRITQELLLSAWAKLGDDHRLVLSMHDIEGYSLPELSAITETPLGTLKSRLHRARARLRELLETERIAALVRVNKLG